MYFNFKTNIRTHGFTIVELMVSIGIAVAIMTTVVLNQSTYIDGASLRNAVDDISLSLSEAQVFGTSVRQVSAGSNQFDAAYGVSINISDSGSNNAYIFFADTSGTELVYDSGWSCPGGASSECLQKKNISNGNIISDICEISLNNTESCNVGRVDITFLRPETQAHLVYFSDTGSVMSFPNPKGVRIEMRSPAGKNRSVIVYDTGQISVQ